ncbi:hypothetical protein [Corynebacterium sp. H130]|uniref:hypothetical protein n=1 Tax=Corynebacterium sp. H130 TaxID=3133444 RepID=UPI0030AE20DA
MLTSTYLAILPTAASASPSEIAIADEVIIRVNEDGQIASVSPSPQTGDQVRLMGERAPDCIRAQSEWGFVQVYNDCPFDLRVKVIFAFGPDSACKLVVAGTRTNISPHTGRIDGIETC